MHLKALYKSKTPSQPVDKGINSQMETKTDDSGIPDHNEGSQDSCEGNAEVNSSGSIGESSCVRLNKVLIYIFFNLFFFICNFCLTF